MTQPNILLILADDMGYGDFGIFNPAVYTPALDGLVAESLCLTQHYSGSPVCSPARAALLTGRYPHRTGALTPQEMLGLDRMALRERTIGDYFQQAGYATGLIGKWHNGALDPRHHPNARGFAEFCGFRGGWADYYRWRIERNGTFQQSDGRYLTDVLTDEGCSFIRRHRDKSFLLAMMYNAPHSPLQAPDTLVQPYLDAGLSPGVAMTYAMIQAMDQGIARLLEALDQQGLTENTIVLFSSDNGPAFMLRADQVPPGMSVDTRRFNCGFNGAKGSVYEGGIRVPMIVRWPAGLDGGQQIDDLIHFTDWLPTLLNIAGIEPNDDVSLDGGDVLPLLRCETLQRAPRRFWQWNGYSPIGTTNAAMRDGDWKLVRPAITGIRYATPTDEALAACYVEADIAYKYQPETITGLLDIPEPNRIIPAPPPPELYNLCADPQEVHNLADQEPDRVRRMVAELDDWFAAVEWERW
ncbi:MAG: sulfatase-like hydrolase/transferase, partial [Caldilineaceae bacterium]|nr:sulfatase-like hydrolase/transferase [Caldilineaceae bacterium]